MQQPIKIQTKKNYDNKEKRTFQGSKYKFHFLNILRSNINLNYL